MNRKLTIGTLCAVLALSTSAFAGGYKVTEVKDGGTISGTINYEGKTPVNGDQNTVDDGSATVSKNKGFANVIVYLKKVKEGKDFTAEQKKAVAEQKAGVLAPRVTLVAAGGSVEVKNSEKVARGVKAQSLKNGVFNEGLKPGHSFTKRFERGHDQIKVTCSCPEKPHSIGFLIVMPHPYYAVTDKDGRFKIDNIPPGKYKLIVEHPSKGKDCEVKVDGKGGAQKKLGTKIKVGKGAEVKVEGSFK